MSREADITKHYDQRKIDKRKITTSSPCIP